MGAICSPTFSFKPLLLGQLSASAVALQASKNSALLTGLEQHYRSQKCFAMPGVDPRQLFKCCRIVSSVLVSIFYFSLPFPMSWFIVWHSPPCLCFLFIPPLLLLEFWIFFLFSWFHWWIWSIPSIPCQWKVLQPYVQADIPVSMA